MKKWIPALFLLMLVLLLALPYLLIPSELKFCSLIKTERNTAVSYRSLSKSGDWSKWWPGGNVKNMPFCTVFSECKFIFNGYKYVITDTSLNTFTIMVSKENQLFESRMDLVPVNKDFTNIQWSYSIPTSLNPFARILRYRESKDLKKNMDSLLLHIKNFLDHGGDSAGSPAGTSKITGDFFMAYTE